MPHDTDQSDSQLCSFEILEALYQLNVDAKRYAEAANHAHASGFKDQAHLYSLRKRALYGLKRDLLEEMVAQDCVDEVRRHSIDDKPYYCFYVGDFSFHSPVDEWDELPMEVSKTSSKSLQSFTTDLESRSDLLPENEALERLSQAFESPNEYLPEPFVDRGFTSQFVGWDFLPGAVEDGDRVGKGYAGS